MAVVTFGGAYAVLAYVAQQAVGTYGWLRPAEMVDGLGSLKEVIENNWTVDKYPEQFAFGLLERYDLADFVRALPNHKIRSTKQ